MQTRIIALCLTGLICLSQQSLQAECSKGSCSAKITSQLPQLEYQVGTKTTECAKSAAELSKQEGLPIKFVIKQGYENKAAALLAMAETTEALVAQFATPTACKVSGKIRVGGQNLTCSKEAAAKATLIKQAMDAVKVSYKVDGKECNCPIESRKLAAESNTNVVFCVGGNETSCSIRHRLNTARAKYRAAVEAVAEANPEITR